MRVEVPAEDRFSRLRLLSWWEQDKIASTKVLVIGAGALGNEILKNLALLGFERIVVVDMDTIENSNLSRMVLYSAEDIGKGKAAVAAAATKRILPSADPVSINANVVQSLGLGVFHWADVILAGLDNREARLFINRAAWKVNRPWVDGAIEGLNGVARVFIPGKPPCYECTLGETDWQILEKRMSCNMLTRAEMEEGKVPTTPTLASIIGGIQVQEAIKLIHGLNTLAGSAFVFEGLNHSSYKLDYTENPDCMSHHSLSKIVELPEASCDLTLDNLLERARRELGPNTVIEFSRDVIERLTCYGCRTSEDTFVPVGSVKFAEGKCPRCGDMRTVETVHSYDGSSVSLGTRRLDRLGLPLYDLFIARNEEREIGFLVAGDHAQVLESQATMKVATR